LQKASQLKISHRSILIPDERANIETGCTVYSKFKPNITGYGKQALLSSGLWVHTKKKYHFLCVRFPQLMNPHL